jgi:hypothetical protein
MVLLISGDRRYLLLFTGAVIMFLAFLLRFSGAARSDIQRVCKAAAA